MPTENQTRKVETILVTKLHITGAEHLDPITVFLEDFEPKKRKITVSRWGKSWTAFWGGMWDGHTVGSFFCQLNAGYIIGYFDQQMSATMFSGEELVKKVRAAQLLPHGRQVLWLLLSPHPDKHGEPHPKEDAQELRRIHEKDPIKCESVLGEEVEWVVGQKRSLYCPDQHDRPRNTGQQQGRP